MNNYLVVTAFSKIFLNSFSSGAVTAEQLHSRHGLSPGLRNNQKCSSSNIQLNLLCIKIHYPNFLRWFWVILGWIRQKNNRNYSFNTVDPVRFKVAALFMESCKRN